MEAKYLALALSQFEKHLHKALFFVRTEEKYRG